MVRIQLWQWLKDKGITQEQAAHAMGYTLNYTNAVLTGREPLTRAIKMAFIETFPETANFLLPAPIAKTVASHDVIAEGS